MNPNFLFLNKGDGTFEDATEILGRRLRREGPGPVGHGGRRRGRRRRRPARAVRDQLRQRVQHALPEPGQGAVRRHDRPSSAWPPTRCPCVGWGCALADFDNDGWPDNFVDQRPRRRQPPRARAGRSPTRSRRSCSPTRRGSGSACRPATPAPTSTPGTSAAARPSATSTTTATSTSSSTTRTAPPPSSATTRRPRTTGSASTCGGPGATATPSAPASRSVAGGRTIHRQRKGGYSLESSNDPRLLIGVGAADEVTRLTVRWPSGAVSTLEHLEDRPDVQDRRALRWTVVEARCPQDCPRVPHHDRIPPSACVREAARKPDHRVPSPGRPHPFRGFASGSPSRR